MPHGWACRAGENVAGSPMRRSRRGQANDLKRKCMGIEPTYGAVDAPHDDFEDRGHHQVCKHFRGERARL
jgi:hypothetical protein